MKTYKEQNYTPKVLLANAGGFIEQSYYEALGKDGNYVVTRSVFSQEIGESKPIVKAVNELYKKKYGHDMNEYSARAFMGIIVLADAINRAASIESESLRTALFETDIPSEQIVMAWEGIKFNQDNGQNMLGKGLVGQLIDGTIKTVWPFDLATSKVVFPIPAWDAR
jgi:branched-chain amino acid transport system substrate-binding protein